MLSKNEIPKLKYNESGLIPVVCQNYITGKVLMQAFATEEALQASIDSGYAVYFSRSRNELWKKGETSGNRQKLIEIRVDCDNDSLLYLVIPEGPACHTGSESCYFNNIEFNPVDKPAIFELLPSLYEKIKSRKEQKPEGSYITSLFKKGQDKIIQKVGEEATETVIALKNNDKKEIVYEASDLLFHLLISLVDQNIKLEDIYDELLNRYK